MIKNTEQLYQKVLQLLGQLIAIPSYSKEEQDTAVCLEQFFLNEQIPVERIGNNLIVRNRYYDPNKPTVLINSHHDTVRPNKGYT
ncbi:MAG: acetylornithine deacetylase, partial [Bacteroidota bacterium]